MGKRNRIKKYRLRENNTPSATESALMLTSELFDDFCLKGYTPLSRNPEIIAAVNKIAGLIGSMSIHLMANTEKGDTRIKNELSKKIDINPNRFMTRMSFISAIVRYLLLEGDGNSVIYVKTLEGMIDDLHPIPPNKYYLKPDGWGYKIVINHVEYSYDELILVTINNDAEYPWKGSGCKSTLKIVAESLNQANETKKGFMKSKWKPSIIVKVDGMTEEFSSPTGRDKLLEKYVKSSEAGQPWLIPADQFQIEQVKPLSLNDLAIKDSVELDKRTVASILDIPPFVLGIGEFNEKAWNNFINTRIKTICKSIEQAFTKALLFNPKWYFVFNYRSLLAYDIQTLSTVGANLYSRGILTGNEVRDSIGYSPMDGLDKLVILENYIPSDQIGNQKKLDSMGKEDS